MALKFRTVERKINIGGDAGKVKTFAVAKSGGYCDMEKLCDLVSARCAMSSADVKAILDSLNWVMHVELRSGNIVQLGEFGNFRLTIRSTGAENKKDFNASYIKNAHIVFSPGASLRQTKARVNFEQEKPYVETEECDRTHLD
ncbi:putative histone-like DNA-binding protein [Parabacteroides sp. PF5-5]|uniref:HU family DNA-binding protein n=1 Tax=unclassified Parabacteroides TaxID=2649774 RepID=UPI002476D273|nr:MULTISPECIES: HU family DNA-binding protein [unclassified Parabacteroides]MDH6306118.1 putative histone-like DNA-binding protein [Parabacteroides sp. PH5-39]MDH6316984.1 putative histone-like DNA-binding protein [Parabacteroides sp. PF5-13]MDH6320737.1 putative histone-like DNA-binding protein [Parabacteroides sp. PH5-13]MDH6324561.1 putative histone-like DNA-binding protein [Parabacteroides sp. PH5-8]MDH6328169.1 putative histone-like DNA-binding protein [Parabacteroides sp. PH5-41]